MVDDRNFVGIIIVVAIFFAGIFYFIFGNFGFNGEITTAHFELFSEETEIGPDMIGIVKNSFNQENIVGISGESNVDREVKLTFKIFDSDGKKINSEWHGKTIKINSGTFSFCCISLPQNSGNYFMKLFLNGRESATLPFSINNQ